LLQINNHNQPERLIVKFRENLEHQEQGITISSHDEQGKSRRMFLGMAAPAGAGLFGSSALAQTRSEQLAGRTGNSATDPGPENKSLLDQNPNSNHRPFTDHGNPGPIWYSFDLAPKRIQAGGWTHQVTQRELPSSKDIAGVNMRLTAGSFRELISDAATGSRRAAGRNFFRSAPAHCRNLSI
jgi:oxalate decarboxylase